MAFFMFSMLTYFTTYFSMKQNMLTDYVNMKQMRNANEYRLLDVLIPFKWFCDSFSVEVANYLGQELIQSNMNSLQSSRSEM